MIKALKANYIITSKSRILKDSSVIIEEDKIKDIVPNKLVSKNKYKTINLFTITNNYNYLFICGRLVNGF